MEAFQYLMPILLHGTFIGLCLSAWVENVPAYRGFSSAFTVAMALAISHVSGLMSGIATLFVFLVVVPLVLYLVARLIHLAATQKGFPSQGMTITGAYRYIWSLNK